MDSAPAWTIRRVLDWTTAHFQKNNVDPARLCAEMLLAHVLNTPRIRLYTDLHRPLVETELGRLRELVRRAANHEPIQYLIGHAGFYGLDIDVTPDVLIPRPETETLVDRAIDHLKFVGPTEKRVLDLCTGSGCVAIALAKTLPGVTVVASDISLAAVDRARANVAKHKLDDRITIVCGDLFEPLTKLPDARAFDLIVSNPPYIATKQIESLDRNVRDYEPRLALDGGEDGLDPHRKILAQAGKWLVPAGRAMLEIAFDQEDAALWIARNSPDFEDERVFKDLGGRPRVLSVRRK